jgi:hypothetical protein
MLLAQVFCFIPLLDRYAAALSLLSDKIAVQEKKALSGSDIERWCIALCVVLGDGADIFLCEFVRRHVFCSAGKPLSDETLMAGLLLRIQSGTNLRSGNLCRVCAFSNVASNACLLRLRGRSFAGTTSKPPAGQAPTGPSRSKIQRGEIFPRLFREAFLNSALARVAENMSGTALANVQVKVARYVDDRVTGLLFKEWCGRFGR